MLSGIEERLTLTKSGTSVGGDRGNENADIDVIKEIASDSKKTTSFRRKFHP